MRAAFTATLAIAAFAAASSASVAAPVVVELYTAQGCASCAKANGFASDFGQKAGVVELTFNVDYWDYLGWKDTFAQPEFAARQRAYDKRFGLHDVYTPQIVINGEAQTAGDKRTEAQDLVRSARRAPERGPRIIPRADGTVAIEAQKRRRRAHDDDVWLVRYDPRLQTVVVKAGDNRGQTVNARNTVRQLVRLGGWDGERHIFHLAAAPDEGLAGLVLVQGENGGRIITAMRLPSGL